MAAMSPRVLVVVEVVEEEVVVVEEEEEEEEESVGAVDEEFSSIAEVGKALNNSCGHSHVELFVIVS